MRALLHILSLAFYLMSDFVPVECIHIDDLLGNISNLVDFFLKLADSLDSEEAEILDVLHAILHSSDLVRLSSFQAVQV